MSPSTYYRNRTPVRLPDPDTLPFPGNLVRQCSDCGLRAGCKAPVPGNGPIPADIMLVGQNPGKNEDEYGEPFIGDAGQYLDSLLFQSHIPRSLIYITNLVKCGSPNNRPPTVTEVTSCEKWLSIELGIVNPRIIVALGAPAIRRFLGQDAGTVEHLHGKPIEVGNQIILPCYHPAAALRNTTLIRQCSEDFQVLRGLVRNAPVSSFHTHDEYPDPVYHIADTDDKLRLMADDIHDSGEFAVDTEQCHNWLWSVQLSARPGTAWFVPVKPEYTGRVDLTGYNADAIVHYYLHDIKYVALSEKRFFDTMTLAYLLGLPQGLKELASRLCGIQMKNYNEVVRPGQLELSLDYLNRVSEREWPDPPEIEETGWNNKEGKIITRIRKPWHITRKVNKLLKDYAADSGTDLWDRWRSIPVEERSVVESVIGAMPESSLAEILLEDAVQYACRDADATIRVYHRLQAMISDLGLDFVLDMDLRILPMVDAMMANGMAVDINHFRNLSVEYDARMRAKAAELASTVGHPFNPNSPIQVAEVVYGELGFKPTKYTPTKGVSTDDQELKKTGHPVAKGIIEYRRLSKMKGTYADNLVQYAILEPSGESRIHTTIKTTRTETGRLSSADPVNLQNIPTRSKEGKMIRKGFIAPDGWQLAEGDYGQIEMCTQAHLARCKGLIDLFRRGDDPHTVTASRIFGVPYEEAKKDKYRYPCKRAGFGIIYMIGAKGLASQIQEYISDLLMEGEPVEIDSWSEDDCQKFIDDYYALYPEIKDYQQERAGEARRYGYVRDMFGRIRYIPEVACPVKRIQEAGFRQASNMPVTASAQGIIKLAMGELWRELPRTEWADRARFLMQIHDSLIVEVDEREDIFRPYLEWMRAVMCGVVELLVPIKVDFKIGKSWGSLEKYQA